VMPVQVTHSLPDSLLDTLRPAVLHLPTLGIGISAVYSTFPLINSSIMVTFDMDSV